MSGIIKGIVTNNDDELFLGRVQIRTPNQVGVPDDALHWALPCFQIASYDSGMYMVPEIGSAVWCAYLEGSSDKLIYLGQSPGMAKSQDMDIGEREVKSGESDKIYEIESIDEYMIFKTPKGQFIKMSDINGEEHIQIKFYNNEINMVCALNEDYIWNEEYRPYKLAGDLTDDYPEIWNDSYIELKSSDAKVIVSKEEILLAVGDTYLQIKDGSITTSKVITQEENEENDGE